MESFGRYGVGNIPFKILISPFVIGLLTMLFVLLKIAGVINDATPFVMVGFGMIGLLMFLAGGYMLRNALFIRKSYILTTAKVTDSSQSVAGYTITIGFEHQAQQHTASIVQGGGYRKTGSSLRILFNPDMPSTAYIYGAKFYFLAAIPLIIGITFIAIVANYAVV